VVLIAKVKVRVTKVKVRVRKRKLLSASYHKDRHQQGLVKILAILKILAIGGTSKRIGISKDWWQTDCHATSQWLQLQPGENFSTNILIVVAMPSFTTFSPVACSASHFLSLLKNADRGCKRGFIHDRGTRVIFGHLPVHNVFICNLGKTFLVTF
jgi:hypothetical protein